jgi:DNA-binding MarR family transcriptional regulator
MPQTNESLRFMRRLWQVVHALDVRSKWMERNLGVTGPQRLVMRIVGRNPDIGASAIAAALEMHPSTLTGILSRLTARGHLRRVSDPSDRRRARFRLTVRGQQVDRERRGTVEAAVRRALARNGHDDVTRTEALLATLVEELERAESLKASPAVRPLQRRRA